MLDKLIQERDEITARLASSEAAHRAIVTQFSERLIHLEGRIQAETVAVAQREATRKSAAEKIAAAADRHAAPAAEKPAEPKTTKK